MKLYLFIQSLQKKENGHISWPQPFDFFSTTHSSTAAVLQMFSRELKGILMSNSIVHERVSACTTPQYNRNEQSMSCGLCESWECLKLLLNMLCFVNHGVSTKIQHYNNYALQLSFHSYELLWITRWSRYTFNNKQIWKLLSHSLAFCYPFGSVSLFIVPHPMPLLYILAIVHNFQVKLAVF